MENSMCLLQITKKTVKRNNVEKIDNFNIMGSCAMLKNQDISYM